MFSPQDCAGTTAGGHVAWCRTDRVTAARSPEPGSPAGAAWHSWCRPFTGFRHLDPHRSRPSRSEPLSPHSQDRTSRRTWAVCRCLPSRRGRMMEDEPQEVSMSTELPVLVGIDGSRDGLIALTWAASYAVLHGASLHAVYVMDDERPVPVGPLPTEPDDG